VAEKTGFFGRCIAWLGEVLPLPAWMEGAESIPFLTRAMIDFCFALAIMWFYRTRGDAIPPTAVIDRSFTPETAAAMRAVPWYKSFRFWASLLAIAVIALYVRFF
jgi:hypothetical protein